MSERPIDGPQRASAPEAHDPLLVALRSLPVHETTDAARARVGEKARASYERTARGGRSEWKTGAVGFAGRAALPLFLGAAVCLYMTWAITTAVALVH